MAGLTDEELEEEKLHELEKVMQSEAEKREEQERIAAEEAVLRARRQEDWVRHTQGCGGTRTLGLENLGLRTPSPTPGRNVCVLKDDFRENLKFNKRCTKKVQNFNRKLN